MKLLSADRHECNPPATQRSGCRLAVAFCPVYPLHNLARAVVRGGYFPARYSGSTLPTPSCARTEGSGTGAADMAAACSRACQANWQAGRRRKLGPCIAKKHQAKLSLGQSRLLRKHCGWHERALSGTPTPGMHTPPPHRPAFLPCTYHGPRACSAGKAGTIRLLQGPPARNRLKTRCMLERGAGGGRARWRGAAGRGAVIRATHGLGLGP